MQVAGFRKRYIDVSKEIQFTPINTSYTNHPNIGGTVSKKAPSPQKQNDLLSYEDSRDLLKSLKIDGIVLEFEKLNQDESYIRTLATSMRAAIKAYPSKRSFLDDGKINIQGDLFESIVKNLGNQTPSHPRAHMPMITAFKPAL